MSTSDLSLHPGWLSSVSIRLADQHDLPALEWEGAYTHFRRVYAHAYQRTQRGQALIWVAEFDPGLLLGQVFVQLNSDADPSLADGVQSAFIHSFRVRPEYRNAGLGNRLLDTAEADLVSRDFRRVYLQVAWGNDAATRLYERRGYQRVVAISGEWSYEDHLGQLRHVSEPGWRLVKSLT